ncbi:MAG: ATP-binding protein [Desulfuromonadales bacterium]|nr:MAG: ATP-binding protein [Desulfuromonadales bacterium]
MPLPSSFCPYVGLQPYTEEERDFFFGRERDQRVIASNLYASSMTILYGASGVGKSSVLMAGVVPMLRTRARTAVVVFRDWQRYDFLTALKGECLKCVALATQKTVKTAVDRPLDELLFSVGEEFGGTILILLDQFEEYFLYHPESEAGNTFDGEFARAVNRDDVDANFLLALREDGLSRLDRFRARIPNLMGNLLRLRHLDAAAAEDAIRKPLTAYNDQLDQGETAVTIEDDLVRTIIDQVRSGSVSLAPSAGAGQPQDVEDDTRIETPFLQLVLQRLWEEERGASSHTLRLATLQKLGGAQEIVRTHLDAVMAQLEPREQTLCAGFFDRLVTPSGTKVACRLDDLGKWAGDLADQVLPVVNVLSESRILRTIAAPASQPGMPPSYEIFHDVLAPAVLDWRRRFVEQQTLEEIRREEQNKRDQERAEREREQELEKTREKSRRMRIIATAALCVMALLASLTFYAFQQRKEAIRSQKLAVASQELAQQRLHRIKNSIPLIKAALSDDPFKNLDKLAASTPELFNKDITFKVTYKSLNYTNPNGSSVYNFKIFPEIASIPGGIKSIASITYRMAHPTFAVQLVPTSPNDKFTIAYNGWGTIDVIAIIEYADPEEAPTIAIIDMEKVQTPE